MMRKLLIVIIISACFTSAYASDIYRVSKQDVNRITCPENITDVIFSEEKGLTTKVSGKELFVKFPVAIKVDQETGEKETFYADSDAEVYIVCGKTYNITLKPANISSQNIVINKSLSDVTEFKGKDTEEIIGALMTLAIENDLPHSLKSEDINKNYNLKRGNGALKVIYKKVSKGGGYIVKEFHIYSEQEVTLIQAELLSFPTITNAIAIALTDETFKGWIRAFVIEQER